MEIPPQLLSAVSDGRAVLFLGAGASVDAQNRDGKKAPGARQLGALLSQKFLGGKFDERPLNQIAELAICEADIVSVQTFVSEQFEGLLPTDAHRLLPTFSWAGLATTNYDRLIESAYEQCAARQQQLQAFIENGDRVEDRMRGSSSLMFLKLHGCVTRIQNPACPLTQGDSNYDAQLLFGRQLFLSGDFSASADVFKKLKKAQVGFEVRDALHYELEEEFCGSVERMEANYILIRRDKAADIIRAQKKIIEDACWKTLSVSARVRFKIAFNFHGPSACAIKIESLL